MLRHVAVSWRYVYRAPASRYAIRLLMLRALRRCLRRQTASDATTQYAVRAYGLRYNSGISHCSTMPPPALILRAFFITAD